VKSVESTLLLERERGRQGYNSLFYLHFTLATQEFHFLPIFFIAVEDDNTTVKTLNLKSHLKRKMYVACLSLIYTLACNTFINMIIS